MYGSQVRMTTLYTSLRCCNDFLDGTLKQVIQHPNGLWTVHALPNGDFVTGYVCKLENHLFEIFAHNFAAGRCDDKIARIFTREPSRFNPTAAASFERAVQEAEAVR